MLKTIPLSGTPMQRQQGTGDQRWVNYIFEKIPDTDEYLMCVKRAGLTNFNQPPQGAATGRGIYFRQRITGGEDFLSVFGNILYIGSSSTMQMNTSTGRVWFAETAPTDTNDVVVICDGVDNYILTYQNVSSQIDENDTTNYPVSSLGPVLYIDGYIVQGTSSGRIYNTNLNSVSSWTAGAFESIDGGLEALHRQKDQIIALGQAKTKYLFNNGNPAGSPFLEIDQSQMDFGIASRESLAWSGETAMFVSQSLGPVAKREVMRIDSLRTVKDVSTPVINRFLNAEGLSISSCTAWMAPIGGQTVYCLNLQFANRSFAYNVDNGTWSEWSSATGGRFNAVSAAVHQGITYLQDVSSGRIYISNVSSYQDSGVNFSTIIQTQRLGFGTTKMKYQQDFYLIGDTTTGAVSTWYSDDDYATSTYAGAIDLSKEKKRLTRLGRFQDRSFTLVHADNAPLRLQLARLNITEGTS